MWSDYTCIFFVTSFIECAAAPANDPSPAISVWRA